MLFEFDPPPFRLMSRFATPNADGIVVGGSARRWSCSRRHCSAPATKDPNPSLFAVSPVTSTLNFSPRVLVKVRAPPAVPEAVIPAPASALLPATFAARSVRARAVVLEPESKVRSTGLLIPAPEIRTVTPVGVKEPAVVLAPATEEDIAVPVVPDRLPIKALAMRSPAST